MYRGKVLLKTWTRWLIPILSLGEHGNGHGHKEEHRYGDTERTWKQWRQLWQKHTWKGWKFWELMDTYCFAHSNLNHIHYISSAKWVSEHHLSSITNATVVTIFCPLGQPVLISRLGTPGGWCARKLTQESKESIHVEHPGPDVLSCSTPNYGLSSAIQFHRSWPKLCFPKLRWNLLHHLNQANWQLTTLRRIFGSEG